MCKSPSMHKSVTRAAVHNLAAVPSFGPWAMNAQPLSLYKAAADHAMLRAASTMAIAAALGPRLWAARRCQMMAGLEPPPASLPPAAPTPRSARGREAEARIVAWFTIGAWFH